MFARRPKESHRDTVTYEIDMLDFCARRVMRQDSDEENERNVYLEAFLLHYRNLIRFFSGEYHREDKGDLSTANSAAWAGRELTPAEIAAIKEPAKALDGEYYRDISKYLQHCTRARFDEDKFWDVESMRGEIRPVIAAFDQAFPAEC